METDCPRGFLISPAPKGHHEIAQGQAKRRPGCVPAFFPNRSMALRGRASRGRIDHVYPETGRRPILQAERRSAIRFRVFRGSKTRNLRQSPRDEVSDSKKRALCLSNHALYFSFFHLFDFATPWEASSEMQFLANRNVAGRFIPSAEIVAWPVGVKPSKSPWRRGTT